MDPEFRQQLSGWNKLVLDPDWYTEETNENGCLVVTWKVRGVLEWFEPSCETGHSKKERAARQRFDGDSLSGPSVPSPRPIQKVGRSLSHAEVLLAVGIFHASVFAALGPVEIKRGKGNKPRTQVEVIERFILDYARKGWPQWLLVHATGRSKSVVAKVIAKERAWHRFAEDFFAQSGDTAPTDIPWIARRAASAESKRVIRKYSVMYPTYPTGGPYWHELRPIQVSKFSAVPVPQGYGAMGRRDDPAPAPPLSANDSTRSEHERDRHPIQDGDRPATTLRRTTRTSRGSLRVRVPNPAGSARTD